MGDPSLLALLLHWLLTAALWWGLASAALFVFLLVARQRDLDQAGDDTLLPPFSAEP